MSEGAEDSSAGLVAPPGSTSPTISGAAPGEEAVVDAAGGNDSMERGAPLGLAGLAGTCCICMQVDQVRGCLRSEKICILPILACLLSLALCTAGLKWVFVDKIFEYEPPTHLDPKRIGQDPVLVADPTLGLPKLFSDSTLFTPTAGHGETFPKNEPTEGPFGPLSPQVTHYNPTAALTLRTNAPAWPGPPTTTRSIRKATPTSYPEPTLESNDIYIPKFSATSTTAPVKTSSHEKQCPEKEKNYCVNGGTCFTIEVAPGNDRLLCRCPNEFTGDRCQNYVMASFYKAEELYQKRVLTITGICIALLVVGIMCVVAYCKTKKQRKKLHDRLRQSLRNERNAMAAMANGPQISSPPTESLQLVSQYMSKNAILAEHTIEKETETSFSTTLCTSSTQSSTAATQTSTKSWSNGRTEIIVSNSHSVLVTSSESSKHVTPSSRRGRLNATGCVRELGAQQKNARDTPDSYKDSPYSERYVSAMTTPNRMSPVELLSPESPKSPPSEISPPLSSLAMSVPSIAVSPQGEEERPLLFTTPPRLRDKQRQDQNPTYQRNSAHYNHAHEAQSPPPSPQRIVEDDDYETTQEYEAAPPQSSKKLANSGSKAKRTKVNGHSAHKLESNSESSSESSSSSESETEDERVGEDTPFLSIQNPLAANLESVAAAAVTVSAAPASACRPAESSRTNPALRLSAKEDLQARLSSVIANQDPIAV
ncbi:pro-neuregulin-1, membrane-bound isoform isoform X3 [Scleropages formosus]|uniref:pro-neuregulin-1, membrane-bound isoform isoform X3 n=1 Tax=Scleropages formosus TaxID=113540 RepID=UPI0010FAA5E8|nr:pro-neuregulin-1, membrane-bound isoform isoform X3 [Scleropages formosus]